MNGECLGFARIYMDLVRVGFVVLMCSGKGKAQRRVWWLFRVNLVVDEWLGSGQGLLKVTEEVHHILLFWEGGIHDAQKLMFLCKACHSTIR